MPKTVDHTRETPESLAEKLTELGFSPGEFAALWGAQRDTARRWLLPENHPKAVEPPYWVSAGLALMRLPGALDALRELHEATKVSNAHEHASEVL